MNTGKKSALIFICAVNIISIIAAVISQYNLATDADITSIIPITIQMTVPQILILNFAVIVAIVTLITIIATYLATDFPYSVKELLSNCSIVFLIIPILVVFSSIFNAINTEEMIDKIWIMCGGIFFLLTSVINVSCALTLKYDIDE